MSDKKRKVPKLRFPGFTDDWEQRKLGAIFQKNEEKNQLGIGSEKTISIASMSYKEEGNGANVDSLRGYKILRIGDIAFEGHTNKSFRFGRFILNDLGTGIMSPRFTSLRPTQKINIHFWKHYIHYEPVMRDILVRSTKAGTMMNELVISEFEKSEIAVPNSHEQVAIGKLFNHYDTLLSLHQRKLDNIKMLKKSLLQKLFPKDGEKIPELRFPGFTDAWEQRKLGDVVEKCYGGGTPQTSVEEYWTGNIPWLQSSNLVDDDVQSVKIEKYISKEAIDKSAAKMIPSHSIAIVTRVGIGKLVLMDESYTTSQDFLSLSNVMLEKQFMLYALYLLLKNEKRKGQGTSIKGITKEALLGKSIRFPKTSIEQHQIGNFVKLFDSLISLHQRQSNFIKNILSILERRSLYGARK